MFFDPPICMISTVIRKKTGLKPSETADKIDFFHKDACALEEILADVKDCSGSF